MESDLITTGFDPAKRELCPDGACVGVIGSDGRCKECGALSPQGPPSLVEGDPGQTPGVANASPPGVGDGLGDSVQGHGFPRVEGDEFDPEKRQLCGDGACVGVIGADGRCKICGGPPE